MKARRRESRESWDFKHFPAALRACALRIDPNEPFDPAASTFAIDSVPGPQGQYVEVSLALNAASVADQARVMLDDLELVLLFSNAESRRITPLWRSSASGHPSKQPVHIESSMLSPRRYEVVLQLVLTRELRRHPGRAWRKGSVLADRSWTIVSPTAASLFAVDWTSFSERQGWDRHAAWRVEFLGTDGFDSAQPEETVQLHVNKDLEALRALLAPTASRSPRLGPITRVLVRVVLSDVTAEILGHVLRWAHPLLSNGQLNATDIQSDSLASQVFKAAKKLGLDPGEASRIAVEDPGRLSMLLQGHFGMGQSLDGAALERMSRK